MTNARTRNRRTLAAYQLGALVLVALLAMLVTSCAGGANATPTPTPSADRTFTAAQLAAFDGTNGQPAYIAVNGVVYDVSAYPQWAGGKHHGYTAGKDLSSVYPHGGQLLASLPVVGTYVG